MSTIWIHGPSEKAGPIYLPFLPKVGIIYILRTSGYMRNACFWVESLCAGAIWSNGVSKGSPLFLRIIFGSCGKGSFIT